MEIEAYHKLLEDKFLTYQELALIDVKDNGEPMVALPKEASFRVLSIDQRMEKYTGKEIFVRQSLVKKIQAAQEILMTMIPDGMLEVVYGYRHLSIQMEAYEDIKKEIVSKKEYADETDLKEEVHHFIAVPEVSGHPTGGAIDIRITDTNGRPFDMGTNIHEFVKDSYVHTPFISKAAWHNRQLLRLCMMTAGFAPYDGEWWHFSYGDREWAKYYGKPNAIYDQVIFQSMR